MAGLTKVSIHSEARDGSVTFQDLSDCYAIGVEASVGLEFNTYRGQEIAECPVDVVVFLDEVQATSLRDALFAALAREDADVEALARLLYGTRYGDDDDWEEPENEGVVRPRYRDMARAALAHFHIPAAEPQEVEE